MKVLAIISARGGSKGVPRKNIRKFGDIPLIAHMFLKAKHAPDSDLQGSWCQTTYCISHFFPPGTGRCLR